MTIYLNRIAILLITMLLSGIHVTAQNIANGIIPDTPPSPQAVAFNRLGDYQVNNNYGVPDISIPLFEIDFHGYKIPLALHYEATPLKPGYNYDVTGLGWTLSGNSCVSRTIKDRADEYVSYSFSTPFMLDPFQNNSGTALKYIDYADKLDQLNFQYDSYNIMLPSGRNIPFFMYKFSPSGVMKYDLMSLDGNVQISCTYNQNSIDAFTVTDENGIIYSFTVADKATNGFDNNPNADRNVTWLLTSINIPSKGTITYEYTELQNIHTYNNIEEPVLRVGRLVSQMLEDGGKKRLETQSPPQPRCPRYKMRFLKSISYGPSKVDFIYYNDNRHMNRIVVSDNNETIRTYTLSIDLNTSQYGASLTSLTISGQDNSDNLVYGFLYRSISSGNHTDYWGNLCYSNSNKDIGNFNMYFNNEEGWSIRLNRNDLQTQLSVDNLVQLIENKESDPYYYYKLKLQSTPNGDTRVPTSPNVHGVLWRITYPNGGYTDFEFENHRFPTVTAADGDLEFDRRSQRIIEGGGFRIKSVTNHTADGTIANEDHYRYGFTYGDIIQRNFPLPLPDTYNANDHIGCGEAVVDPNLLSFMTFSYYINPGITYQIPQMVVGHDSNVRNMINPQGSATWWDLYFSANTFRALLGGRRPVVYPEITVYHGDPDIPAQCNSKTVYRYDIYSYTHDSYTYYLSSVNQTPKPDTAYFERISYSMFGYPSGLISDNYKAAKRHQLKSKSDYSYDAANGSWNLVYEEKYSYNEESLSKEGRLFDCSLSRVYRSNYTSPLGNKPWLWEYDLSDFYQYYSQCIGRFTMSDKITTTLRQGGTRTQDNVHKENYSYLYSGVLSDRYYTDLYYRIRDDYRGGFDKKDLSSYVGNGDLYIGQENADTIAHALSAMRARNMLTPLASAETFALNPWDAFLTGTKINYRFFGNNILPFKLYESNGEQYEESLEVKSYDGYGNPTEIVDSKTGIHSVYLWDTYGRYLMAMINNAELSQIGNVSQLLAATSWARYAMLRTLLPNAQIQTWDYKPLIGVSSHTDVNGQTTLYEYDGLGRLKSEKRMVNGLSDPEILRKYEYNYLNPSL